MARLDSRLLSCGTIGATEAVSRALAGEFQLVDATWALSDDQPLGPTLAGTSAVIDTAAIKAIPVAERSPAALSKIFSASGLADSPQIALYDRAGLFSAPWVWWMLLELGYTCLIVQGSDPRTCEAPTLTAGNATACKPHVSTATLADVLSTDAQIVDARGPGRFAGTEPEPRQGLRSGHMPGAINMPFGLTKRGDRFLAPAEIFTMATDAGIDLNKPIITTCGSGVTASALAFLLSRAGAEDVRVYMGSWAEYGATDHPVETGA